MKAQQRRALILSAVQAWGAAARGAQGARCVVHRMMRTGNHSLTFITHAVEAANHEIDAIAAAIGVIPGAAAIIVA